MAVAYNKFWQAAADLMHGVHNFSTSASIKFMLSNTTPTSTMATSTDITQISSGNGYSGGLLGGIPVSVTAITLSNGLCTLSANPATLTAGGGNIGPFQFSVLYNAGSTVITTGPLLGWYDYGTAITLHDTDSFTLSS